MGNKNAAARSRLFDAVVEGSMAKVRSALEEGGNPNQIVREYTALGRAVEDGNTKIVKLLVAHGADPNRGGIVDPLHDAVRERRIAIAKALVQAGADVNYTIENETTPLMMAALAGSASAAKALLDAGADANARNEDGRTAYELAVRYKKKQVAEVLKPHTDVREPPPVSPYQKEFIQAVNRGDVDSVHDLIGKGVDLDAPYQGDYDIAVEVAANRQRMDVLHLLLEKGACPDAHTYAPAIAWAARRGNIEAVRLLASHGATIDCRSSEGETALMCAAAAANTRIAAVLIELGADLDAESSQLRNTPLALAYDEERRTGRRNRVVDLLIDAGATNLGAYENVYRDWKRPEPKRRKRENP
ncbi:MAG: ankyrin repeat domain-containing protein [Pirellulales bacterium]